MKARIIGIVLLAAVLGGLYVVFGQQQPSAPQQTNSGPSRDEQAIQNLKLNP